MTMQQDKSESPTARHQRPALVVFSSLFPSPTQPAAGIFIRERMFRVGNSLPVVVVCPRPWFPFQGLVRRWKSYFRPDAPARELQRGVEVLRPRFLSVPGMFRYLDGWSMAIGAYRTLRSLHRQGRLDILDAHFAYPDGYAAVTLGRWLGIPTTITLRGTEKRHAADPILSRLLSSALSGASRIFAVAEALRRVAIDAGASPEKVRVIGNGVDNQTFYPIDQRRARQALQLPYDAKVLISVGGLVERKGFHRVIDCLPALRNQHPGIRYLIVGGAGPEGDWTERLKAQVNSLGLQSCVNFIGPMAADELRGPLSASDVFVLATRNEGWANVFLEAMACGLPIVTTDVGGNREVVSRPELGTIVPFDDAAALSAAIDGALTRDWNRDLIIAFARANDWDAKVKILVNEFLELGARFVESSSGTTDAVAAPASGSTQKARL
jgi:glycosyltransferase involved in cell wall biosynthesis